MEEVWSSELELVGFGRGAVAGGGRGVRGGDLGGSIGGWKVGIISFEAACGCTFKLNLHQRHPPSENIHSLPIYP